MLWFECASQNSCVRNLISNVTVFSVRAFKRWSDHEGFASWADLCHYHYWVTMGGDPDKKTSSVLLLPLSPYCLLSWDDAARKPSPDATILTLDFPVSRTVRNKCYL
jgi:hypothetical protein